MALVNGESGEPGGPTPPARDWRWSRECGRPSVRRCWPHGWGCRRGVHRDGAEPVHPRRTRSGSSPSTPRSCWCWSSSATPSCRAPGSRSALATLPGADRHERGDRRLDGHRRRLLAIEREDGTLLRAKATPNGMVGYLIARDHAGHPQHGARPRRLPRGRPVPAAGPGRRAGHRLADAGLGVPPRDDGHHAVGRGRRCPGEVVRRRLGADHAADGRADRASPGSSTRSPPCPSGCTPSRWSSRSTGSGAGMRVALLPEAAGAAELGGELAAPGDVRRAGALGGDRARAVAPMVLRADGAPRVRLGGGEPQAGRAPGVELTGGSEQRDRAQPHRDAARRAGHLAPGPGRRAAACTTRPSATSSAASTARACTWRCGSRSTSRCPPRSSSRSRRSPGSGTGPPDHPVPRVGQAAGRRRTVSDRPRCLAVSWESARSEWASSRRSAI